MVTSLWPTFLAHPVSANSRAGFKCVEALGRIRFPVLLSQICLQCFDAVGWAAGRSSGL